MSLVVNAEDRGTSTRVREFGALAQEFAALSGREDVHIVPFRGEGPAFFAALPEPMQNDVLGRFREYVGIARDVVSEGGSLRNDQMFLWRFFQRFRIHPPSNLISEITAGEIIEVHDINFTQIFRNMRFFDLCSYSLDDLLCRPFWELVHRDPAISAMLVEQAGHYFSGRWTTMRLLDIPEHVVQEIDSTRLLTVRVRHRLAAPLRDVQGAITAVASFLPAELKRTALAEELSEAVAPAAAEPTSVL